MLLDRKENLSIAAKVIDNADKITEANSKIKKSC